MKNKNKKYFDLIPEYTFVKRGCLFLRIAGGGMSILLDPLLLLNAVTGYHKSVLVTFAFDSIKRHGFKIRLRTSNNNF